MIRTQLCNMLGIKHPIIQAGMGPFQTNKLAVAVANAGGLGIISTSGMIPTSFGVDLGPLSPEKGDPYEVLKRIIHRTKEATKESNGIFGVNVMVSADYLFRDVADKLIQATVDAIKEDSDIEKRMKVIITSAGDPLPWTGMIKPSGATWLHVVPTVRHAKRAEKAGADVIIASGHEAGGHTAWVPVHTMVLLPAVVEAVDRPVVAAGGICDGASVAAALALGAVGVQMGTRFIATQESDFVQMWKNWLLKCKDTDSLLARGFVGPLRYLRNKASENLSWTTIKKLPNLYLGEKAGEIMDPEVLQTEMEGHMALLGDDEEKALFYGGEAAGRISDIPTTKELMERIMREAEEIIRKKLPKLIV